MEGKIVYRILYLGNPMLAWCEDQKRFIPAGMHLYVTTYDELDDALKAVKKVKRACSGWADEICLDSLKRYI